MALVVSRFRADRLARLVRVLLVAAGVVSCCPRDVRRLEPDHVEETIYPRLKLHYRPGRTAVSELAWIAAGDILVTTSGRVAGSSCVEAFSAVPRAGIVVPHGIDDGIIVLTAQGEVGVLLEPVAEFCGQRALDVYAFPAGALNLTRLERFAGRAAAQGRLDYDYSSAFLGFNSNLTPNRVQEVADEYTSATVVAAALHFSGLSPDGAYCGVQLVSAADLHRSPARKNTNLTAR